MKPHLLAIILLTINLSTHAQRTQASFDRDWKFQKTSDTTATNPQYNDASWRTLNLPHDWSIEDRPNQSDSVRGPFSLASIGATATGYTIGGTAFYRKHFIINQTSTNNVTICFDGVYMNSDVWLNGHHLGNHPYGYTPFYYNLTPYLNSPGTDNVLAVRVRNEGRNSRWYSGSGIYRHVTLITTNNTHIQPWGLYITTPSVSSSLAAININTKLRRQDRGSPVFIQIIIRDKADHLIHATPLTAVDSSNEESAMFRINFPHLWSPGSPDLYTATTSLYQNNKVIDSLTTSFGIRSLSFTAANGRAEERKIELLKAAGYNAIRTSHNPPSVYNAYAISSIVVHGTPDGMLESLQAEVHHANVIYYRGTIKDETHCGMVEPYSFDVNVPLFSEAQKRNTCLYKKISIDKSGNIKNCPSMTSSFGSIDNSSLIDIVQMTEFTSYWNINKDKIQICRDCEFRYVCTDCRAYTQGDNLLGKPAKCNYDPYTAKWIDVSEYSS